jgi:hypothetical protein
MNCGPTLRRTVSDATGPVAPGGRGMARGRLGPSRWEWIFDEPRKRTLNMPMEITKGRRFESETVEAV